ncbi:Galactan beta-1,4-galactosyltransferase GALS3 [Linum perenne]
MPALVTTLGYKMLPDWGYDRVYTVVIVNCTFPSPINTGGKLYLLASTSGGGDAALNITDRFEVLDEPDSQSFSRSTIPNLNTTTSTADLPSMDN